MMMAELDLSSASEARKCINRRARIATSKSIRQKCLDCSGDSWREVQLCQAFDCPLWLCRFGKRPTTVLQRTPEWLDPVHVAIGARKQGLRECGHTDWINPLTNARENLCGPSDPTLIASYPDDDAKTASGSTLEQAGT